MNWDTNEARTDVMERAVFSELKVYATKLGMVSKVTFDQIRPIVEQFNATQETEANTGTDGLFSTSPLPTTSGTGAVVDTPATSSKNATSDKLKSLNAKLIGAGFDAMSYYSVYDACTNRLFSLQGLQAKDYPGAILTIPPECPTSRPSYQPAFGGNP